MAGPDAAVTSAPSGDEIFDLLGELRDAGFTLGIREHLIAQKLALACRPEDGGIDPVRLRNWLAPALCTTPEEQRELYRVFQAWWSRRVPARRTGPAGADQKPPTPDEAIVKKSRPWKWVVAFAGVVVLVTAAGGIIDRLYVHRVVVPDSAGRSARPAGDAPLAPGAGGGTGTSAPGTGVSEPRNVVSIVVNAVDQTGAPVAGASVHTEMRLSHAGPVASARFSPDATRIVTASEDKTARVWDAKTGQPLGSPLAHNDWVVDASFSPDGTRILTASKDKTARVWDTTGQPVGPPLVHPEGVESAAFSPDGTRIVTASYEGARVWSAITGTPLAGPPLNVGPVSSAAFSPDGTRIVTASPITATARVWDAATNQEIGSPVPNASKVGPGSFSPDGTRIVTTVGPDTAIVWDAASGQRVGQPLQHQLQPGELVDSASFSRDGSLIVTAAGGRMRIWNAATGQIIYSPFTYEDRLSGASFSPDGTQVVALSVNAAVVWDAFSEEKTDASGIAHSISNPAPTAQRVVVGHPDFQPAEPYAGEHGPGQLSLRAELSPRGSRVSRWLIGHVEPLRLFAAVVPFMGALCWSGWALYRRRLVLQRRASTQAHDLARVALAEPTHHLYRGEAFVRARIEARRRQAAAEGELDTEATIERTIRRLGFFSPVFRPRSRLPAYLALIDRAGFHDQQAQVVEEFLGRLREGGVAVDSYTFDRDPRLCTSGRDTDEAYRSLWELAALHSEHRLILFGDGSGLADPATGRVAAWIHGFAPWSERALLTPVPACHWSAHELELAGAGFRVVPFTPAGLRLFVESLQPANLRPALLEWRAPYPPILAEQPGRWQGRGRPRSEEIDDLCWQLRAYLGTDGFRWLCALAVYPAMDWFLTLYMGLSLRTPAGVPLLEEELLLALARLPWLRHGYMPDWLRLRLVSELGIEDGRIVRALLENLLRARLESPGSRFQLDVARPPAPPAGRRWRRFFADLLGTEPPGSPLQDYVFVEFLMGRRPRTLQVPAPGGWRRWVYHRGLRSLGIKPVTMMAAAALLAFTATLGARPTVEWFHARQTPATPSRITQTSWTPAAVTTEIPDLISLELDAAVSALKAARLTLGSSDSSDRKRIVSDQSPKPGAVAPEGSRVDLKTISVAAFNEAVRRQRDAALREIDRAGAAGLDIGGYPTGAAAERLTIDGTAWTGQNPVSLPAGEHTLVYDARQYGTVTRHVTVTRGRTTKVLFPRVSPSVKTMTASGYQGNTVRLNIFGRYLGDVKAVEIGGPGVRVDGTLTYSPEGAPRAVFDDGVLVVTVTIGLDAAPGKRTITLIDSAGWRTLLRQVFEVLPAAARPGR